MQPLRGTPQQALFGATLGFLIGFAAVALFGPTAARFREVMHLSPMQIGLLVAAPSLSGSLLRIPFAAWVDTTGGRKPFLVLLLLSVIGMLGLSLVINFLYPDRLSAGMYPVLLVLGVLSGCGIATFSVGIGQVSYWFPHARQGRALAIYAGVGNLAPGIFSLILPIALVAWGLSGAYIAWLSLLVAGTVAYAFLGRNAWYFQLRQQGLATAEARRQAAEHGQQLFPSGNLVEGLRIAALKWRTWFLVFVYFTTFGGFVALTAWLPTYWSAFFGMSTVLAGFLTGVYSILTSIIRILGGMMSDELQEGGENTAILALLIMVNGAMLMSITNQFQVAIPAILLMAIGMGICNAAVFKLVPQVVPEAVGGAAGWVGGLGAFGGFVIPQIMSWAVRQEGHNGYALGFITFIVLALIALSLMWVLKYTRPGSYSETAHFIPAATVNSVGRNAIHESVATTGRLGEHSGGVVPSYRVIIDAGRCWDQAERDAAMPCDRCVRASPEVLEKLHPNASARVRRGVEPGRHLPQIREAIRRCPAEAILLIELAADES